MQTALVIILLIAILAAVSLATTDGYRLATSHACMGLAEVGLGIFFTLLVGCGLGVLQQPRRLR
jgi:hypothetical protein